MAYGLKASSCDPLIGVSETHFKDKPNEIPGSMLNIPTEMVVKRVVCACIYLIKSNTN